MLNCILRATYREDSQTLYGFIDRESRDFFKMIVDKVSGIGPKIALNLLVLYLYPPKTSIASGDVGMLSKAQRKKTAERIVLELKDKVLPKANNSSPALGNISQMINLEIEKTEQSDSNFKAYQDAVSALLTLGYKATDADRYTQSIGRNWFKCTDRRAD